MDVEETDEEEKADYTPAIPLEISSGLASQIDDQLRDFAEDAELETALVVDQSGALVSGISAEEEVTIEVISALVAGASGAMRALAGELGETGSIESFHQGENRIIYLGEIIHRFVLVGVCSTGAPLGVIREKANQIRPALVDLLLDLEVPEVATEETKPASVLRKITVQAVPVKKRIDTVFEEEVEEESSGEVEAETIEAGKDAEEALVAAEEDSPNAGETGVLEEAGEESVSDEAEAEVEVESEEEPEAAPEMKEVIEVLEFDESEIVIEDSGAASAAEMVDSPFEMEFEEEEEASEELAESPAVTSPLESIFELEDDSEEVEAGSADASSPPEEGIFELDLDPADEEVEDAESPFELEESASPDMLVDLEPLPLPETVSDSGAPAGEAEEPVFEFDDDSEEDEAEEAPQDIFEIDSVDETEEETSDARSSGPQYF